jgi:hypothetical protein
VKYALAVETLALDQLGACMAAMPKNQGTKAQLRGDVVGGSKVDPPTKDTTRTLDQEGITKHTADLALAVHARIEPAILPAEPARG